MKPSLFPGICILGCILFGNPVPAQEGKDKTDIQHEVIVSVKLVQVYVTDKDGNPVQDLGKEDFVIYQDGKRRDITEFEQHVLLLPSMANGVQPEAAQERPLPPSREFMNRKFFLLFDFAYSSALGILRAKKAALHFIDNQLQPLDEVAVLSYSAIKSLSLHEYLTLDHQKVRQIIESFGLKEIHGRAENLEAEYWARMKDKSPLQISKEPKDSLVFGRIESLHQAANFAQKMSELAKALRYVPGYKNLLLFSSGVPYSMMYKLELIGSDELRTKLRYEEMIDELAASNTKVYILNTEDLSMIADNSKITGMFSLRTMADSTGGKYLGNISSYKKHMETVQELTGCYYVLGYYINEKRDGEYHKIEVKVNRPGCEVHAQKGYFNPKPFSEYSKLEKTLHLVDLVLGEGTASATPVRFPMAALPCVVKGETNLSLFSKIDKEKIQELGEGQFEIVTVIFDTKDNVIRIERDETNFSKLPGRNIYWSTLLRLAPGEYKCRLVIRNLGTGKGAVASSLAMIPLINGTGIDLQPPLLLKREGNARYLKAPSAAYPFDSSRYSPAVEGLDRGMHQIWALLRCSFSAIQRPDIRISANLVRPVDGIENAIPLTLSVLQKYQEPESEIYLIGIDTEELQPGEYCLSFFAKDESSSSLSQARATFNVR